MYLVARLGVTGARSALAADLAESLARVRQATPLPIAVGFGISTPSRPAAWAGWPTGSSWEARWWIFSGVRGSRRPPVSGLAS